MGDGVGGVRCQVDPQALQPALRAAGRLLAATDLDVEPCLQQGRAEAEQQREQAQRHLRDAGEQVSVPGHQPSGQRLQEDRQDAEQQETPAPARGRDGEHGHERGEERGEVLPLEDQVQHLAGDGEHERQARPESGQEQEQRRAVLEERGREPHVVPGQRQDHEHGEDETHESDRGVDEARPEQSGTEAAAAAGRGRWVAGEHAHPRILPHRMRRRGGPTRRWDRPVGSEGPRALRGLPDQRKSVRNGSA